MQPRQYVSCHHRCKFYLTQDKRRIYSRTLGDGIVPDLAQDVLVFGVQQLQVGADEIHEVFWRYVVIPPQLLHKAFAVVTHALVNHHDMLYNFLSPVTRNERILHKRQQHCTGC